MKAIQFLFETHRNFDWTLDRVDFICYSFILGVLAHHSATLHPAKREKKLNFRKLSTKFRISFMMEARLSPRCGHC